MTIIGRTRELGLKGRHRHPDFEDYIVKYSASRGVEIHSHRVVKFRVEPDGDVFIGEDVSAAATTNLALFTVAQTYNSESVGAGDMLIGDNTASKANIFWDKSAGQLLFRGGQTTQITIDTDGSLKIGNGDVIGDSDGIRITPATTDPPVGNTKILGFKSTSDSGSIGKIFAYRDAVGSGGDYVCVAKADRTGAIESSLQVKTAETHFSGGISIGGGTATSTQGQIEMSDDLVFYTDGKGVKWSDVYLYRSAANILKTDDSLLVALGLNVGSAASAGTGAVRYSGDLESYRNSTYYTGYAFVPLTTMLTSTSWDGDSYSTTAKTLIDLSAVFSAPAGIKAVLAYVAIRDSGSAAGDPYIILSPVDTDGVGPAVSCSGLANDAWSRQTIIVPCDSNGDVYYQINASGASTADIYIRIWGYWI